MNDFVKWLIGDEGGSPAGVQDWRVGFVAEYNNYAILAMVAVAAAMIYLTVRSYRREGDAPPRAKAVLAGLRVAVIALVLAVLFRPAIVLRYANNIYTSVAVVFDDSLSMSFTDRYASPAERDRLAASLDVEPGRLAMMPRSEIARRSLGGSDGPLAKLAADHPLVLLHFSTDAPGREAYTRALGTVDAVAADPGAAPADDRAGKMIGEMIDRLTGRGYETNIPAALRDTLDRLQGRRLGGVVLVSDGQLTTADGRDRLAGALAYAERRGVPLYSLRVGDATPPKNLAVTSLHGPRESRRGSEVEFTAAVAHRNLDGRKVTVRLLRRAEGGGEFVDAGASAEIVLNGSAGESPARSAGFQTVRLMCRPDEIGQFTYRAVVDVGADEANPSDNAADARLRVSDEKINVLLVSAAPDWEFRYVKNVLLRQADLYRVSVWQQNADPAINQDASTGMKLTRLPRELDELIGSPGGEPHPGYDVVILHDPQPTRGGFDERFAGMLKTFVQRHGGGVCYVAGRKHTDPALRGNVAYVPLADMLPVVLAPDTINAVQAIRRRQPEPWPVRLTAYGLEHPVTRLGDADEMNRRVWDVLPGIFWSHPVVKPKPAARVLAVSSNPVRRTADNDPQPLAAVQPFGRGRVLYLGFDETWRWRFVDDAVYHRRFWTNAVRYLATLQARQVVITAGGDRFAAGERITVETEAYDEKFQPLTSETFDVQMIDVNSGDTRTLTLDAVADKPGRYRKTIVAKQTGTYELTALSGDPQAAEKVASKRIVVQLPQAETRRTEADAELLANVASRPENVLDAATADRLTELIPPGRLTVYRDDPRELWDSNITLILIVVLLGGEWILRKKYNMA